jgi:cytochrome oxidase Cu insertion factor (SCO1/SenC/PrrC family)
MRTMIRAGLAALALLCMSTATAAVPALGFQPPAPGSYRLYHILRAPDGPVLAADGKLQRLATFTTGKVTLFSFIYTYCSDPKGCPLAYETLHTLRESIRRDRALRDQVRFVSMSFDPRNDTPDTMRLYGDPEMRDQRGVRWDFLTTRSGAELAPLLDGFGQDVSVADEQPPGQRVPVLSHLLKVYLIDSAGSVREIYSTAYLHPAVLLGDIKTLLLERRAARP